MEISRYLTLFCTGVFTIPLLSGCETPPAWYYKRDISPELRELVINTDIRKSDVLLRRVKVDRKTSLLVFDPFLIAWLEGYLPIRSLKYLPSDHTEIDTSQRIVFVQVTPNLAFYEEGAVPGGWQPIDTVDARRDGKTCQTVEVRRRPITTPSGEHYPNQGYYGFDPVCFSSGGLVELVVWRDNRSTVVPVSQALQQDLAANFRIFDSVMADLKAIRQPRY